MYTKALHSIATIILVIIFQLPSWMQLEHSFHDHNHIYICDATGATKHIHLQSNENCSFLHQALNYNFTFETPDLELPIIIDQYKVSYLITSSFSLQILPFTKLRAPPFSF